jgi:hypothetical protein
LDASILLPVIGNVRDFPKREDWVLISRRIHNSNEEGCSGVITERSGKLGRTAAVPLFVLEDFLNLNTYCSTE